MSIKRVLNFIRLDIQAIISQKDEAFTVVIISRRGVDRFKIYPTALSYYLFFCNDSVSD